MDFVGMACGIADVGNHASMSRKMPEWLDPEYRSPDEAIVKLMKDHRGVPYWGVRESGPTGLFFFPKTGIDEFLKGSVAREFKDLKLVLFHDFATKSKKREWLAELGMAAVREGCSRTRIGCTEGWAPLLRKGRKPFGLTQNWRMDGMSGKFYDFTEEASAHVFGDNFTLAQRREYAKSFGADVGLVEPLKGKERK